MEDEIIEINKSEYDTLVESNNKLYKYAQTVDTLSAENKRLLSKISDHSIWGNAKLFKELLPILDSIEFARSYDDIPGGLEHIFNKLDKVLYTYGLEEFSPEDNINFNPDIHNAVAIQNNEDKEDNVILEVSRNGYKYRGKILRHADVVVNKINI